MIKNNYGNLEGFIEDISHSISKIFNAFLILELIPATGNQNIEICSLYDEGDITITSLKKALENSGTNDIAVTINQEDKSAIKPPLRKEYRKDNGIFWIGLTIPCVIRGSSTNIAQSL